MRLWHARWGAESWNGGSFSAGRWGPIAQFPAPLQGALHRAPAAHSSQRRIKDAFDPRGILNPGKSLWPDGGSVLELPGQQGAYAL
ncbi:FAD-linked oxidase C-terminal domain-containing protein [Streptomyces sp. ME02-8801-2C]|uniref:FAD-linked oxidase C-terminal domain-containing protein n=1 Tax=Streptomyces sp. ME02-8801-2C TaxID=3028680 RepID=UPI0029B66BA0|nr:FAD-linked oxidase C-terminal domain-containing protein [Streptomyces sp. ME02-8801-2C]MDX3452353.1 FAD-linked oxidase C-terminal domain-containing protein [Streptomyces sp. ME02-8801-2C]